MRRDIVILGEADRKANRLLTTQLFDHEAAGLMRRHLKFAELQRIHELRKSCGVESEATATVHVRLPPRYGA
jgi:hypothetical protein